jgi:hypothetical protein
MREKVHDTLPTKHIRYPILGILLLQLTMMYSQKTSLPMIELRQHTIPSFRLKHLLGSCGRRPPAQLANCQ